MGPDGSDRVEITSQVSCCVREDCGEAMQNTSSYLDELCHALPTVLVKMCTFVLGVGCAKKTAPNQLNLISSFHYLGYNLV